jgi:hypothetical protein
MKLIKLFITLSISISSYSQELMFIHEKELLKKYPENIFSQDFSEDGIRYLYTTIGDAAYCCYFTRDSIVFRYINMHFFEDSAFRLYKKYDKIYKVIDPEQEKKYFENTDLIKMWKASYKKGTFVKIRMYIDKDEEKYVFVYDEWQNIVEKEKGE